MVVEWFEGGKRHERTVSVRDQNGVLQMGDQLLGAGSQRLLRTGSGWQVMWAGRAAGSEPDPSANYRFSVTRAATVAHRPATRVLVRRTGSVAVRERMFFDDATGILLRRDQLDANGRLARRFTFVEMTLNPVQWMVVRPTRCRRSIPNRERTRRTRWPMSPTTSAHPKRVGNGFVLSGVYSQPDGSVQLYYSDGLLGALGVRARRRA